MANFLQIHFLRSTRQDPGRPERPLSIHDFNYFARKWLEKERKERKRKKRKERTKERTKERKEKETKTYCLTKSPNPRFQNKKQITLKDFDEFMEWFGKILRRIRHSQAFHAVWEKGLVYGFISRGETEALLQDRPLGTFLIRFSESIQDKIVISSRTKEGCEHMLIAPHQNESHTRLLEVLQKTYVCHHLLHLMAC